MKSIRFGVKPIRFIMKSSVSTCPGSDSSVQGQLQAALITQHTSLMVQKREFPAEIPACCLHAVDCSCGRSFGLHTAVCTTCTNTVLTSSRLPGSSDPPHRQRSAWKCQTRARRGSGRRTARQPVRKQSLRKHIRGNQVVGFWGVPYVPLAHHVRGVAAHLEFLRHGGHLTRHIPIRVVHPCPRPSCLSMKVPVRRATDFMFAPVRTWLTWYGRRPDMMAERVGAQYMKT